MRDACANCGTLIEPGFLICPSCGAPVGRSEPAAPQPTLAVQRSSGQSRRRLAYLVVKTGPHAGQSTQLTNSVDIGRDAGGNHLVLNDIHVSAYHGRVRLEDGSYVYHDMASTTGSWQVMNNGERRRITQPLRLMHGDVIEMGKTRLVFMQPAP